MQKKRWMVPVALLMAVVLAGSAAFAWWPTGSGDGERGSASSSATALADLPSVVAVVDGEKIAKKDFTELYRAQREAAQQQPAADRPSDEELRQQVVQAMVTEALLRREASRRGIDPNPKQVTAALTQAAQQNSMTEEQLVAALKDQGLSRAEIDEKAAAQAQLDLLVADEAGTITASDKEVRALYRQLKQQQEAAGGQTQQVPALKSIRPQLEEQVKSQKQTQAARDLIDALRSKAEIDIRL